MSPFNSFGCHSTLILVSARERLYPVADATTFFTDLHYILRVIAAGNIRTVCHHRLNLLEQVIIFSLEPVYLWYLHLSSVFP